MATKKLQVYKCELCGNIVEVLHEGGGTLSCCGQKMKLFEEKTADKATEKHVPVVEKIDGGFKVTVGSTLHPMKDAHFIEWIQLLVGEKAYREFLKPDAAPEATFLVDGDTAAAREFCNLHGLWRG